MALKCCQVYHFQGCNPGQAPAVTACALRAGMSPHEFKHALVEGLPIRYQPVAAIPEQVLDAMARAASDPSRHFARESSGPLGRSSMDYNQVLC